MRVAFLSHNQPLDQTVRPKGGWLSKDDAEQLVADLLAERISQKIIRAFPPESSFRILNPYLRTIPAKLPPVEIENCKFVPPISSPQPSAATIRAHWDWSEEAKNFFQVSARSRSTQTNACGPLASPLLAG